MRAKLELGINATFFVALIEFSVPNYHLFLKKQKNSENYTMVETIT